MTGNNTTNTPPKRTKPANFTWDQAYDHTPPWEIGRPQNAIVHLAMTGAINGPRILDAGCGTGENSLYLAGCGFDVTGIDIVPAAIRQATEKARDRALSVRFEVGDSLNLAALGRTFDTVIDSGLFHALNEEERRAYAIGLAQILSAGGQLFILCFSDKEPLRARGPSVSQSEIRQVFDHGWKIIAIEQANFAANFSAGDGGHAWLAKLERSAES